MANFYGTKYYSLNLLTIFNYVKCTSVFARDNSFKLVLNGKLLTRYIVY